MKKVITFGTFDIFHEGHLQILNRAREMGDELVVGVSSDAFNYTKKGRYPIMDEGCRMKIVGALKCVDEVFLEQSMELKQEYIDKYKADLLVMGDDWSGHFKMDRCQTVYLPRKKHISTSEILDKIRS